MIDNPLAKLKEQFGTKVGDMEYLGEPRKYNCEEHGVQVIALVYDPYDVPSFVCSECGESLEFERL